MLGGSDCQWTALAHGVRHGGCHAIASARYFARIPALRAPMTVRLWEVWGAGRRSATTEPRLQVWGSGPGKACAERVMRTRASSHSQTRRCRPRRTGNPSRSPGSLADHPGSKTCRQASRLLWASPSPTLRSTARQARKRARRTPGSLSAGSGTPGTTCKNFLHVPVRMPSQIAVNVKRVRPAPG